MPGASTDHNFVTAIPSKGETEDELPGFRCADPRNVDFDMFSRARFADYALHHKTARGYVESPEQLWRTHSSKWIKRMFVSES